MSARLVWATPDAQKVMAYCARVSNPRNQRNEKTAKKLLHYCFNNRHFSVFEMASMCVEITTSRTIARQILRHRSFSFQEFSQRYAEVEAAPVYMEARRQDTKNRQNSIADLPASIQEDFSVTQQALWICASACYRRALAQGIAKECARVFLPEGMTQSTMYMTGTVRSWIHYVQGRTAATGTQAEHVAVANEVKKILLKEVPALKGLI